MQETGHHTPPQFFVDNEAVREDRILLHGRAFQKARVQRLSPGELFFVVTSDKCYKCVVEKITSRELLGSVMDETPKTSSRVSIHLFAGILKGDKFDLVIGKATELGVSSITPIVTSRVIPRLDREKTLARKERWQKIAIESSEQCHRTTLPVISAPVDYEQALSMPQNGLKILFSEGADDTVTKPLASLLNSEIFPHSTSPIEISAFVGPEGGFDADEIKIARDKGCKLATLGPTILRAETASIAAVAVISAFLQSILEENSSYFSFER